MRVALLSAALFTGTVLAGTARADVGPRAPCGAGTHHQYLYGHHCVTNGYHLERGPDGHVEEVQDGKELATPPTPTPPTPVPTSTATATPTATPTAAPTFATPPAPTAPPAPPEAPAPPPEPPSARGCGCDLAASSPGIALGSIALGVGLLGLSRRRRRSR